MLGLNFEGAFALPGLTDVLNTTEAILWWGRFEQVQMLPAVIAGAARDAGNTPTDVLRPGLLLGKKTSDGKLYQWDQAATDGTEIIYGVLMFAQKMQAAGSDVDRFVGWVMVAGPIKADGILVPGQASAGISGQALEHVIRNQMQPRFLFNDKLQSVQNGVWGKTKVVTGTTLTLTDADNGTVITNLGASDVLEITFPAPHIDMRFKVIVGAAQAITLTPASAGQLVVPGSAAANTLVLPAEIGVQAEIIGLSTGKFAVIVTDAAGGIVLADGGNLALGTTTGSKIGTAVGQKLGFWNATPVVQPASANQAVLSLDVDVTGADTVDKAAINTNFTAIQTLVNQLRADLVTAGLIKGSA